MDDATTGIDLKAAVEKKLRELLGAGFSLSETRR
jgi:hypothetical protein